MFVVRDTRKITEILEDDKTERRVLDFGRREAEFNGSTKILLDPSNGKQLTALTDLSLYGNRLTALSHVSTLASYATGLRELNLGNNELTDLPASFGDLRRLESLWLEDNALTTLPLCVTRLTALKRLRLSGNKLVALPSQIKYLSDLEELAVDNNQLTSLPPEVGDLLSLKLLLARGNALTELPPEIGALASLVTLSISSNRLTHLPDSIGSLTALTTLQANGNALTDLPIELARCTHLAKVNVANNHIAVVSPALVRAWARALPPGLVEGAVGLWQARVGVSAEAAAAEAERLPEEVLSAARPASMSVMLDGNPIMFDVTDLGAAIQAALTSGVVTGVVPLTEAQYAPPLIEEVRRKMKRAAV